MEMEWVRPSIVTLYRPGLTAFFPYTCVCLCVCKVVNVCVCVCVVHVSVGEGGNQKGEEQGETLALVVLLGITQTCMT